MQLKKHNSKTPPEERPKWLRRGIALIAAIATLATGGVVASTAYAGGGGGSQNAGGWSGGGKNDQGQGGRGGDGGRPGVCATGGEGWAAGMPLRTTSRLLLIAGRTWACMRAGRLCGLFPFRGPGGSSPFPC